MAAGTFINGGHPIARQLQISLDMLDYAPAQRDALGQWAPAVCGASASMVCGNNEKIPAPNAKFAGTNDTTNRILLPGAAADWSYGTGPFSFETWFQTTNSSVASNIFRGDNNTNGLLGIQMATTGALSFFYFTSARVQIGNVASGTGYNDGRWHQVVGTRDVSAAKAYIYVDGVLRNNAADTGGAQSTSAPIEIGRALNQPWVGSIGPFRAWKRTLTPTEVWELYQRPFCMVQSAAVQRFLGVSPPPVGGNAGPWRSMMGVGV